MPLQIPEQEYLTLVRTIGNHPMGATVTELLQVPGIDYPKRTLQRRLEQLVREGRLQITGAARSQRYHVAVAPLPEPSNSFVVQEEPSEYFIDDGVLSVAAQRLKAQMKRPLAYRMPVGYKIGFLQSYVPNKTFYLSADTRQELAKIGQVGMEQLPAGTHLRQVMNRLLIDLSWNSSRLEGNTYSLLETEILLEKGESAEGKNTRETQMILNHKNAIEMLADQAGEIGFNRYTICNLHALLAENLLSNPAACGSIRNCPVGIGGTVYHPLNVPQQIEEYFDQILEKAQAIEDPFEQAFFAMVHLPYLQPFEDVNKRVSRLAANIPLVKKNLCPLSFVDMEQQDYVGALLAVYELNDVTFLRDVFVWAYRRSCARYAAVAQTLGDPDPFRLRHRQLIGDLVREVVALRLSKSSAAPWIAQQASKRIADNEQRMLIHVVETELCSLHIGNIARYRLRPSEFESWQGIWNG